MTGTVPTKLKELLFVRVTKDAHSLDDQLWTALRQHYDEGEMIEPLIASRSV